MNEKFYALPQERQNAIIVAGYRIFSQYGYQKSPMQQVADEAGISKALLFHYFHNKKEFYLFLWEHACQFAVEELTVAGCYEETDFFKMIYKGMKVKMDILRRYPDLGRFILKAYYEKHEDVHSDIQSSYKRYFQLKAELSLSEIPDDQFTFGVDKKDIFQHIYWVSHGYFSEKVDRDILEPQKLEKDFEKMILFWKNIYGKRRNYDG